VLTFKEDGADGVCDVDDAALFAAVQQTLPWKRGQIFLEGSQPLPPPPMALAGPVLSIGTSLSEPLPYFAEPEPLEALLRLWSL